MVYSSTPTGLNDATGLPLKLYDRVAAIRPASIFGRRIMVPAVIIGFSAKMLRVEPEEGSFSMADSWLVYPDQLCYVEGNDE